MSGTRTFAVDALAFDLDGTLLDTVHDLANAVNRLLAEAGLARLAKARIRDLIGKGIANLVTRAVTESRGVAPDAGELDWLLSRYQRLYEETLGHHTVLFDGVVEGLERLRAAGFRLAVVTNKATRFVAPHLERAGIGHLFDTIVGGDDAPAKKPDPAPLRLAAARLGVAPANLLMVGDSGNDALAARAAGCPIVIVPYGYNEGQAVEALACDGIVSSLAMLPDLCRRASGGIANDHP
jgi:phosphoglycolate phosphatase